MPCLLGAAELKDTQIRAEPNVSAWNCHLCWCWLRGEEGTNGFSAFHFLFAHERWALFSAQLIITTFCRVMSASYPTQGCKLCRGTESGKQSSIFIPLKKKSTLTSVGSEHTQSSPFGCDPKIQGNVVPLISPSPHSSQQHLLPCNG